MARNYLLVVLIIIGTILTVSIYPSLIYTAPPENYNLSLSLPPGYRVVTLNGAPYTSNTSNFTIPPSPQTLNWCISNLNPWFQTDTGDVRASRITNLVPEGTNASTGLPGNPLASSLFISSQGTSNFSAGNTSNNEATRWVINNESSYNTSSTGSLGSTAYSFYKSQSNKNGVPIKNLSDSVPGCSNTTCDISGLTSGVYEISGDITITRYAHQPNTRILLLAKGNVTIDFDSNGSITIPKNQNNLFVLAVGKNSDGTGGNLTISSNVGSIPTSSTNVLEGLYTAEANIIIRGNGATACITNPAGDKRLNIGGALISNSLYPFATGGSTIQNQRSLCANDARFPTLKISSRPDFLFQLSDSYKAPKKIWREVQP